MKLKQSNLNGKLYLYYGPMFSGKSEILINKFIKTKGSKIAFKPKVDHRTKQIYSRNGEFIDCYLVSDLQMILSKSINIENIFIDEVQFFKYSILKIIKELLAAGKNIFLAGLDYDYALNKFIITKKLLEISDYSLHLLSKCVICGADAEYTARMISENFDFSHKNVVVIENLKNEKIKYFPFCKKHHPQSLLKDD